MDNPTTPTDEHPAAKRMRLEFEAKYGSNSALMRAANKWFNVRSDYGDAWNRDRERPITEDDVEQAERAMLALASTPAVTAEPVRWLVGLCGDSLDKAAVWSRSPTPEEIGGWPGESVVTPLYASPVHQPCAAPSAEQELRNIVNAKRWGRERFDDDSAFADWCTSRAGHTLMLIERERAAPSADGVAGDSKPDSGHTT